MADVYNQQRDVLKQRIAQQGQQQNEALQRRFAAMGGGPGSGAMEKAQQLQQEALGRNQEEGMSKINAQEQGAAEEQKQRDFQAEQAGLQREQQKSQFEKQLGFQEKQFDFNKNIKLQELDQQAKQMNISRELALINSDIAKHQASKSGGLFGGGGFLGLGL